MFAGCWLLSAGRCVLFAACWLLCVGWFGCLLCVVNGCLAVVADVFVCVACLLVVVAGCG